MKRGTSYVSITRGTTAFFLFPFPPCQPRAEKAEFGKIASFFPTNFNATNQPPPHPFPPEFYRTLYRSKHTISLPSRDSVRPAGVESLRRSHIRYSYVLLNLQVLSMALSRIPQSRWLQHEHEETGSPVLDNPLQPSFCSRSSSKDTGPSQSFK